MDIPLIDEMFKYHAPTSTQIEKLQAVREDAKRLAHTIMRECPLSADRSAAIRKVREAVMTANASIVLKGIA